MSVQLLELLILAGVAFFLVNRLISMLGHSEEGADNRGFFGEGGKVKDITASTVVKTSAKKAKAEAKNTASVAYEDIINTRRKTAIYDGFKKIAASIPDFDPRAFINGAAKAVPMIISVASSGEQSDLETLVDKRFIDEFKKNLSNYPEAFSSDQLKLTINDVYFFANNAFIKVKIICAEAKFKEEWVFSKNMSDAGPSWLFCNIG